MGIAIVDAREGVFLSKVKIKHAARRSRRSRRHYVYRAQPDSAASESEFWPFQKGISGNEAYVTVSNERSEMNALQLADQHCAKYGKAAKFDRMEPYREILDCVPKSGGL